MNASRAIAGDAMPDVAAPVAEQRVELAVGGMTCAACARRVEKRLNKVDGVTATVNYATEKASVTAPADLGPDELVAAVVAAGYTAIPLAAPSPVRTPSLPPPGSATSIAPPATRDTDLPPPSPASEPPTTPGTDVPATGLPVPSAPGLPVPSAGGQPVTGLRVPSAAGQPADELRVPSAAGQPADEPARPDADPPGVDPAPHAGAERPTIATDGHGGGDQAGGHRAARHRQPADATLVARRRLLVSAALSLPVVALAMVPAWQFDYWQWLSVSLATPVVAWGGWSFHRAAARNLRHGAATMDTLVSLGTLAAFGWSGYALVFGTAGQPGMTHPFTVTLSRTDGSGASYLEVAAGVTTFILAGRYFEARAKRRAGAALRALLELGAKDVAILSDNGVAQRGRGAEQVDGPEVRVPVDALTVGTRFVVRPGEKIAADGVVEQGSSAVDASLLTGESVPVEVGPGDPVTGGCVNTSGRLVVRATSVGPDTQLAQIARLVEQAQAGKAQVQRLADRVAGVFVPVVIGLALLTLAGWLVAGAQPATSVTASVAVLIIACPCALGLATPTALLVGTGRGAQLGILIKGPEVLESTRRVDTVVLDKTGTLTTGHMSLREVHPVAGERPEEVLRMAAAAEDGSLHPIAVAVLAAARRWLPDRAAASAFQSWDGLGVCAVVGGHQVLVGRPRLLLEAGQPLPAELTRALAEAEARGHTVVAVGWDGRARGLLVLADQVKPTAAVAVAELRRLGMRPVLLTGDNVAAAQAVAAELGIEDVIAEVLPAEKAAEVARLREHGRVVAMVGDGVNDAAALATADLGIAMGTGSDVAIEAGDLTVVRGDPRVVADAIRLSRRTLAVIKGNLFWAFAYNVAALPLAAAGLLNPMIAGAAMALSSVLVVSNSLRLRRFH